MIREVSDGVLVNTPTSSRSVPAEDASYNHRSIALNGSDESMVTGADDTLASKTYSFWAKSDETGANGVFDHGHASKGAFSFNYGGSGLPIIYSGSTYWVKWDDNAAQDNNAWHHHVIYVEHDTLLNSKWYVDGVLQDINSSNVSGSAEAYTTALRIGRAASVYFDGSLSDFAVFEGELSAATVTAIYNNGVPADLSKYSPTNWWRMGEGDDTGGSEIKDIGSLQAEPTELITNGDFSDNSVPDTWNGSAEVNLAGWTSAPWSAHTAAAHFTIADGACRLRSDGTNVNITQDILTAGLTYEYSLEVTDVTAGGITAVGGGVILNGGNSIISPGVYTGNFSASGGTTFYIKRYTGTTDVTFDNVSVKQALKGNPGGLINIPTWTKDTP